MKRDNTSVLRKLLRETVRRSYSICSAPSETKLQVGIKQIPNGRFSGYVNQKVLQGSVLSVGPPEGRFVLGTPKEGVQYTASQPEAELPLYGLLLKKF